jgi:hypothetical protein
MFHRHIHPHPSQIKLTMYLLYFFLRFYYKEKQKESKISQQYVKQAMQCNHTYANVQMKRKQTLKSIVTQSMTLLGFFSFSFVVYKTIFNWN